LLQLICRFSSERRFKKGAIVIGFIFLCSLISIRQKQHIYQGAAKQGGENLIKIASYVTAMEPLPEAAATACGSQASIKVATDVIDMIADIRSHDKSDVSLENEHEY